MYQRKLLGFSRPVKPFWQEEIRRKREEQRYEELESRRRGRRRGRSGETGGEVVAQSEELLLGEVRGCNSIYGRCNCRERERERESHLLIHEGICIMHVLRA